MMMANYRMFEQNKTEHLVIPQAHSWEIKSTIIMPLIEYQQAPDFQAADIGDRIARPGPHHGLPGTAGAAMNRLFCHCSRR